MTRVKTGYTRRQRHNKILKATKGYRGARSRLYKTAHEAYLHAGEYSFAGRKLRKRDFRKLWIKRINAGLTKHNLPYSKFIKLLGNKNIALNRKSLADIALNHPEDFDIIVEETIK